MGKRIAIAGASGFVGQNLVSRLVKDTNISLIRGLSRSKPKSIDSKVEYQSCDLFSLKDVESGLSGIDEAIYLVHSMLPSSELAQGNFEDYDLLLADNFARSCVKNKVKRVIYLSGIIPTKGEANPSILSQHLRSRLEVETIFRSYGIKLVSLRASIIMGRGGSSFEMIIRLVERLPAMICPAWTLGRSNPIHVIDVCESFRFVLSDSQISGVFDLAGPDTLSYREMIRKCADHFKKRRLLLNVPLFSAKLSRLWVSKVTGAPANLVYPLIESLRHEMLSDPKKTLTIPDWRYKRFEDSLKEMEEVGSTETYAPKAYVRDTPKEKLNIVQSVQRILLPEGYDAEFAAQAYTRFLNSYFDKLLVVETVGQRTSFFIRATHQALLELEYSLERSTPDRVLFYIKGGLLDRGRERARLEFRKCRHENSLIVAIHDYNPSLPWYIYKYTQAILHLRVMKAFSAYLKLHPKKVLPLSGAAPNLMV